MPKVNPNILKWARETAGLSPDEAVAKLDLKPVRGVEPLVRLEALESGEKPPSRAMLVKMAKHYHRPLLTFYLSSPPRTGDRGEDFRTLPDMVGISERALVDVVVRDIRARQDLVKDVLLEEDDLVALPFIASVKIEDGIRRVVEQIINTIEFDRDSFRAQQAPGKAFSFLRKLAEKAGIFVLLVDNLGSYHTTISVDVFRGFALADPIAPFVAVNANDSRGAWSFTLVHELTHLFLGATGISARSAERKVERFCNDVASEILVPRNDLATLIIDSGASTSETKAAITFFANARNVSSTMVAYKLYRAGSLQYNQFLALSDAYRQDFFNHRANERARGRDNSSGPSYPIIRQHRAGNALVRLVERMIYSGNLTTTKAGKVLGVKAKNVHGVIEAARPKRRSRQA